MFQAQLTEEQLAVARQWGQGSTGLKTKSVGSGHGPDESGISDPFAPLTLGPRWNPFKNDYDYGPVGGSKSEAAAE